MKISMMSASLSVWGIHASKIAAASREMGLDGIEWVTSCNCSAKELRHYSEDNGLPVVCYTFWAYDAVLSGNTDPVKAGIDFALELGAPRVMIPFCVLPDPFGSVPPYPRSEAKKLWLENFHSSAELLRNAGLEWMIENYPGRESPMVYADDFFDFLKVYPDVKLVYDDGNSASCEDEILSLQRTWEYVRHVHFKDWAFFADVPPENHVLASRPDTVMAPRLILEGEVRTSEVWNELKKRNYSGYVSLEYEGRHHEPIGALTRVTRQLREME